MKAICVGCRLAHGVNIPPRSADTITYPEILAFF